MSGSMSGIKVDKADDVLSGQFKPVTSKRYFDRAHERILHLTKSGDVVIDRLAIGVPFADKSNINRRKHPRDRRCGTNVWFIPYEDRAVKNGKVRSPCPISCRAAGPLHQAAWGA
jgi:site-specific DNA-methyltransferase (adenine-specific)